MAIIGSAFAMLGRFAGKLLNTALGWATLLLFGMVEGRKQAVLLLIALGSLLWIVVVAGVVVPDVGTFTLAFVPVPDFVDEGIVRLVMLAIALAIPLLIGIAAIYVTGASARPRGRGLVAGVLRGYPITLVLAVTIVFLAAISVVRKVRSLLKRWHDAHVPIVVKPGGYDRLLEDLRQVLDGNDLNVQIRAAPAILSVPPRLLDAVAGRTLGGLVPDRLMLLAGPELEVLLYPSDVAISGTKHATARARAAIAARLTRAPAYMTTSAEAQRLEDEIAAIATAIARHEPGSMDDHLTKLRDLDVRIARLSIPFDEWETVYRERLQVERDLLAAPRLAKELGPMPPNRPPRFDRLVGLAGVSLIAIDLALVVAERLLPSQRR
jgi:hypothetical protein